MKKIYLLLILLINLKLKNCFRKNIKKNSLKNSIGDLSSEKRENVLINDLKHLNKEKKDILKININSLNNEEKKKEKKNNDYSFLSLKIIPFILTSLLHTGVNQIPRDNEIHHYAFEKSPIIRYMLRLEERKNSFLYIFFIVISFLVVIIIAFFIFKYFFNF
ncbi:apical rhoptry neck protein, putative [Plasmodium gallinaceum]|uniref:Apical rhoptry neck protein, putative n=1 Tax=Plasmodium gallinaceum TaxID=5849 RepID=A0A1J1GZ70_PLAGA|nr:apical rhoptry neck protein, putative [Plasmodium gallinaceum]CRG97892.1 apical rhoptry neck protein, putative [Plasmodium gallinaceum]